jgi:drug/metabolite transporter (DMT)-like permease
MRGLAVVPDVLRALQMTVRLLRTTEKTNVMVFYLMLCTLLYSILGCALTWRRLVLPATWLEVSLLVGQGLFGYGNQICITKGLANAKAASVMCMQYFSIVISQLAGMLLFGEYTTLLGDAGMVIVVVSMLIYVWCESRTKAQR